MKKFHSVLSILLVGILLFGMLPMPAAAEETNNEYMTMQDAAAYVRKELAEFKTNISVKFFFEDPDCYTDVEIMEMFLAEVWKHTGVPDEGDYIKWSFQHWGYDIETTFDGNTHYVSVIGFNPTYNNTAEQEAELEQKLDQVFLSLDLDKKSDYEKIKAIYEYVCKNVAYVDEITENPLSPSEEYYIYYSAYGALVLGSTTCQGFSSLVYRMMLKAGIDCRIIAGDDHGWNIVKLDGKYYYLDSTWDSDNWRFKGKLEHFLSGSASFRTGGSVTDNGTASYEHKTWVDQFTVAFLEQYPISVLDYSQEELLTGDANDILGSGQCGNQAQWTLTGDGKLTVFGSGPIWDAPSGTFWNSKDKRWDGLHGYITQVEIQEGITAIGDYAFMNCPRLTQVSIAASVQSLGEFAFGLCENLTQITLPDSVKTLGTRAFHQCVRLEHIILPAGMKEVAEYAFMGCTSLKSVVIPEGIRTICTGAFAYCTSLQGLEIPASVTTLEDLAFLKAFDPTAGVVLTVPETVTEVHSVCFDSSGLHTVKLNANISQLDNYMFNLCHTLRSVELSDTIQAIAEGAFYGCANLQDVKLPAELKDLGLSVFTACTALKTVELPATLEIIPANTFLFCSSLEEVVIPANITEIGNGAYNGCENLKKVTIPAGVRKLDGGVFSDCPSLTQVIFEGDAPEIGINPFAFAKMLLVYYPQDNATWTQAYIEQLSTGGFVRCLAYVGDIEEHNMQWHSDENSHWIQCTDCDFGFGEEMAGHGFDDDSICPVCGYEQYSEHNLQWILVDAYHSHECVDCGMILIQEGHRYEGSSCVVCGYDPTAQNATQPTQSIPTKPAQNSTTQPTQSSNLQEPQEPEIYLWIIPGIILGVVLVAVVWILIKKKKNTQ